MPSGRNRIPDRWEDYSPVGGRISDTRFIAFKVPLQENISRFLPMERRFSLDDLFEQVHQRGYKLGLVIDLTNTTRYYNAMAMESYGVKHVKIFTEGHVVPNKTVRMKFKSYVDSFLEKNSNNEQLIGVHCTHGINRTGYLICRYMIDSLKKDPEVAIQAFNTARGYPIERDNYLTDLRSLPAADDITDDPRADHTRHTRLDDDVFQPAADYSHQGHGYRSDRWGQEGSYGRHRSNYSRWGRRDDDSYQSRSGWSRYDNESNCSSRWSRLDDDVYQPAAIDRYSDDVSQPAAIEMDTPSSTSYSRPYQQECRVEERRSGRRHNVLPSNHRGHEEGGEERMRHSHSWCGSALYGKPYAPHTQSQSLYHQKLPHYQSSNGSSSSQPVCDVAGMRHAHSWPVVLPHHRDNQQQQQQCADIDTGAHALASTSHTAMSPSPYYWNNWSEQDEEGLEGTELEGGVAHTPTWDCTD